MWICVRMSWVTLRTPHGDRVRRPGRQHGTVPPSLPGSCQGGRPGHGEPSLRPRPACGVFLLSGTGRAAAYPVSILPRMLGRVEPLALEVHSPSAQAPSGAGLPPAKQKHPCPLGRQGGQPGWAALRREECKGTLPLSLTGASSLSWCLGERSPCR